MCSKAESTPQNPVEALAMLDKDEAFEQAAIDALIGELDEGTQI